MVLDCVNSSEGSPIFGLWDTFKWEHGWLGFGDVLWGSVSEEFFVFLFSPGGHEVVADGEGVLWVGVNFSVLSGVGGEDSLSEVEFFLGSVRDTVGGDVLKEFFVRFNLGLENFIV